MCASAVVYAKFPESFAAFYGAAFALTEVERVEGDRHLDFVDPEGNVVQARQLLP